MFTCLLFRDDVKAFPRDIAANENNFYIGKEFELPFYNR